MKYVPTYIPIGIILLLCVSPSCFCFLISNQDGAWIKIVKPRLTVRVQKGLWSDRYYFWPMLFFLRYFFMIGLICKAKFFESAFLMGKLGGVQFRKLSNTPITNWSSQSCFPFKLIYQLGTVPLVGTVRYLTVYFLSFRGSMAAGPYLCFRCSTDL